MTKEAKIPDIKIELEKLCDPHTKENLSFQSGKLVNLNSGEKFTLCEGIPIFLSDKKDVERSTELIKAGAKTSFSWAASHWNDLAIGKLLGKAEPQRNGLLSFGSGSPVEKKYMNELGYNVISLDINAKYKGVDIIADGHKLPIKDKTFGTVTAFEVLEHLHSPWVAIQEINRVLKPGGRFVGSVAFLKEFHSSYFHMTHWGVISLLEHGGFEIETVYGGQNVFSRLIHNIFPLGPSNISKAIYSGYNSLTMFVRRKIWSMKNGNPNRKLNRFDRYPFSFNEFEQIKFSPTILFSAKKIKDV